MNQFKTIIKSRLSGIGFILILFSLLLLQVPFFFNMLDIARHGIHRDLTPTLGVEVSWLMGFGFILSSFILFIVGKHIYQAHTTLLNNIWLTLCAVCIYQLIQLHWIVVALSSRSTWCIP
ncbi:hypothetical protein [Magnetococcus sp. PR-3]|uniref:hypothetical protein n=1 Tax=Magnetococcus sp. PR-3 TaxID=3120355 RepID=UPI002FCDF139